MDKKLDCSECKRKIIGKDYFLVDSLPVCYQCLFGNTEPLAIFPIGIVHCINSNGISRIELFPYQRRFTHKLEEEKWLSIIYYLHQTHQIRTKFKRGKEGNGKEVGVFASRTPHRTSRIAVSQVELIKVSDANIHVKGLDAFEGSPVLDIKAVKYQEKKHAEKSETAQ